MTLEVSNMSQRLNYVKASPEGFKAMRQLQAHVDDCGLEHSLLELVRMRVSQINGCAHCLDMHSKDARAAGETEQRLYLVSAWRDAPMFSSRERAALAWAEALTLIAETEISDELYDETRRHFSEEEIVNLTAAIVAINGWNRFAISLKSPVGNYRAGSIAAMLKKADGTMS